MDEIVSLTEYLLPVRPIALPVRVELQDDQPDDTYPTPTREYLNAQRSIDQE